MMTPTSAAESLIQPFPYPSGKNASIVGNRPGRTSCRSPTLGDDVRQQFAFDLGDLVLQQELALFQPLQFQLVDRCARCQPRDHLVEVTVLSSECGELRLQSFGVK